MAGACPPSAVPLPLGAGGGQAGQRGADTPGRWLLERRRRPGGRAAGSPAPRRDMRLRYGPFLSVLCLGAAFPLLWYAAWQKNQGKSGHRPREARRGPPGRPVPSGRGVKGGRHLLLPSRRAVGDTAAVGSLPSAAPGVRPPVTAV